MEERAETLRRRRRELYTIRRANEMGEQGDGRTMRRNKKKTKGIC